MLSQKLIQKKSNRVLETQKTIVLRSKDEYAIKHGMCSETITEQIDVAEAAVENSEKCRRQRRSHLQKLRCDSVRYQHNLQ